jgi:hypothetical protein
MAKAKVQPTSSTYLLIDDLVAFPRYGCVVKRRYSHHIELGID